MDDTEQPDAKRPPVVAELRHATIYVNGSPLLDLEEPIRTRPQDWAPAARAVLEARGAWGRVRA